MSNQSIFEITPNGLADLANLKDQVERHQVVVIRGLELDVSQQMEITRLLGEPEESWEDHHPKSKFLQLMDSRTQVRIAGKSSSKFWHLDRSFMPRPTRFTLLHAVKIGDGARGTQFINSRRVLASLPEDLALRLDQLHAIHDFTLNFPRVMTAKGYDRSRITTLKKMYPPAIHPMTRKSEYGDSLYFSELCVARIVELSPDESDRLIDLLRSFTLTWNEVIEHTWRPRDTLIWDNFSTIHRARPDGAQGIRVLHRSTAS